MYACVRGGKGIAALSFVGDFYEDVSMVSF